MKDTARFSKSVVFYLLAGLFCFASCTREDPYADDPLPEGDYRYIDAIAPNSYPAAKSTMGTLVGPDSYADLTDSTETKTYLGGDGVSVYWNKGDNLSAYTQNGGSKNSATNENEDGATGRFFLPNVRYSYAYYPGDKGSSLSGNVLTVTGGFPTEQQVPASVPTGGEPYGFSRGVNLMVAAAGDSKKWTFNNAGALVSFRLGLDSSSSSESLELSSITLTDNSSSSYSLTGNAKVTFGGGEISGVVVPDGNNYVTISGQSSDGAGEPQQGGAIVLSKDKKKTFYAVVAPGTFGPGDSGEGTIQLTLTRKSDGATATFKNDHQLKIDRNDNILLADFNVNENRFLPKGNGLPASWYASNYTSRTSSSKESLYSVENPAAYLYPYNDKALGIRYGTRNSEGKLFCNVKGAGEGNFALYRFAVPNVTLPAGSHIVFKIKGCIRGGSSDIKRPYVQLYSSNGSPLSERVPLQEGSTIDTEEFCYPFKITSAFNNETLEVEMSCESKTSNNTEFQFAYAVIDVLTTPVIDATWTKGQYSIYADKGNNRGIPDNQFPRSTISCDGATLQTTNGVRVYDNTTNPYTVSINVVNTYVPAGSIVRMTSAWFVEGPNQFNVYANCPSGACENSYTYFNITGNQTLRNYDFLMNEDVDGDFTIQLTRSKQSGTYLYIKHKDLSDLVITTVSRNVTKFEFKNDYETLASGNSMALVPLTNDGETNLASSWSSSNPGIASVDANGNVEALHDGTTVITATSLDGTHTATCTLTVSPSTNAAKIKETGVQYSTLQAAYNAATNGQTIVLLKDNTEQNNTSTYKDGLYYSGKTVTFDLNGYSIKRMYLIQASSNTITINNGTVGEFYPAYDGGAYDYNNSGPVFLNNVKSNLVKAGYHTYTVTNDSEILNFEICGASVTHTLSGTETRIKEISHNGGTTSKINVTGGYFGEQVITNYSANIIPVNGTIQHIDNTPYPGYVYKFMPYIVPQSITLTPDFQVIPTINGTATINYSTIPAGAAYGLIWETDGNRGSADYSSCISVTDNKNGTATVTFVKDPSKVGTNNPQLIYVIAKSPLAANVSERCVVQVRNDQTFVARSGLERWTTMSGAIDGYIKLTNPEPLTFLKDIPDSEVGFTGGHSYELDFSGHNASGTISFHNINGYTQNLYGGSVNVLKGYYGSELSTGTINIHDLNVTTQLITGQQVWNIGDNCTINEINRYADGKGAGNGRINISGENTKVGSFTGSESFPVYISGGYFTSDVSAIAGITVVGGTIRHISDSPYPGYDYKFVPALDGNASAGEVDKGNGGFTDADF